MVSSPVSSKRRFSDQTLAMNINANAPEEMANRKRRQTIGGDVHHRSVSTVIPTPTKQKVSLGSAAASAYYFSGLPKTPRSTAKSFKPSKPSIHNEKAPEETNLEDMTRNFNGTFDGTFDGEDSSQSTGVSDIMNKSVLSDTTELTASNFVLAVSSRQKLIKLADYGKENTPPLADDGKENTPPLADDGKENTIPSKPPAQTDAPCQPPTNADYSTLQQKSSSDTSHRERLSTSPFSLRKLTQSIKESRLQSDQKRVSILSPASKDDSAFMSVSTTPVSEGGDDKSAISDSGSEKTSDTGASKLDVSMSSLDDLFDGLMDAKQTYSPELSLLVSPHPSTDGSPHLEESPSFNLNANDKPRLSLSSPGMSPISTVAAEESSFRLTPSKKLTKLTPTKLKPSPRRVLNLNATDSPARNTRSAGKNLSTEETARAVNEMVGSEHSTFTSSTEHVPHTKLSATKVHSPPNRVLYLDVTDSPGRSTRNATENLSADEETKRKRAECESAKSEDSILAAKKVKSFEFRGKSTPIIENGKLLESSKSDHGMAPKSILNSAMKRRYAPDSLTRKTVAFGSPEAAEYHIGSPSVSLTPMPSIRAKAMFSIPRGNGNNRSFSSSDSSASSMDDADTHTVDIEVDVNQMLHYASEYIESSSPKTDVKLYSVEANADLSPSLDTKCSADSSFLEKTIQLESSLNGIVQLSMPSLGVSIDSAADESTKCSADLSFQEKTIQLESSLNGIVQLSMPSPGVSIDSAADESNSTIGTENASSIHLDISDQETKTVELERTIQSLLHASSNIANSEDILTDSQSNPGSPDDSMEMTDSESIMSAQKPADDASTDSSLDRQPSDFLTGANSAETPALESLEDCNSEDEDNTVELEADMSALLAMASQGSEGDDSLPALKLTDRFPKTLSTLVPPTNRMSFGQQVVVPRSEQEEQQTPGRLDFGLFESPASTRSRRRKSDASRRKSDASRRRFSLAKTSRLSVASEGSVFDLSHSEGDLLLVTQDDGTNQAVYEDSVDTEELEETFTVTNQEINEIIGFGELLQKTSWNRGFQSAVQSLCQAENVTYSQISDSIVSFAVAVCGEVEEKAVLSSNSEACFSELLHSIDEDKLSLQSWIRDSTGENEIRSIASAIRGSVEHEWSSWEKMVLDSLIAATGQIGDELEPESSQLDHCMTLLDDLNEFLSISAGKAARKARRRSMARHKVRMWIKNVVQIERRNCTVLTPF